MEQYISKSALVTEMNKLKNISLEYGYTTEQRIVADVGKDLTLKGLLDYIDTLKVKEVNLKKEIDDVWKKDFSGHFDVIGYTDFIELAKYFFELGLKAQKGEET